MPKKKKTKDSKKVKKRNYFEIISESKLIINNNQNISQKLGAKKLKLNYKINLLSENETNNLTYTKSIKNPMKRK